jgi:hypothetical protein
MHANNETPLPDHAQRPIHASSLDFAIGLIAYNVAESDKYLFGGSDGWCHGSESEGPL